MHFIRSDYLNLLWVLLIFAGLLWRDAVLRRSEMRLWAAHENLRRLTVGVNPIRRRWVKILELLALLMMILTLARPAVPDHSPKAVKRVGLDIVFAVDISESMLAQDFPPNRLEKMKRELTGLIDTLEGHRIGIVAFAGNAIRLCPLTTDVGIIKSYMAVLDTKMASAQGTAMDEALSQSLELLKTRNANQDRVIVLLTDGEDHGEGIDSVLEKCRDAGIRIFAIGIGSDQGEPIPIYSQEGHITGHKKDQEGEIVLTHLDESLLRKMALETKGEYYRATIREDEIGMLRHTLDRLKKGQIEDHYHSFNKEFFQVPLIAGFIFCILCEIMANFEKFRWGAGKA